MMSVFTILDVGKCFFHITFLLQLYEKEGGKGRTEREREHFPLSHVMSGKKDLMTFFTPPPPPICLLFDLSPRASRSRNWLVVHLAVGLVAFQYRLSKRGYFLCKHFCERFGMRLLRILFRACCIILFFFLAVWPLLYVV